MFGIKKGAMFGLDARIALAIFGALSVISGAALYSAIQDSKVTALLADINEIGKAWEAYMLDTGQDLPAIASSGPAGKHRNLLPLINNTVAGSKGPYLPYEPSSSVPASELKYKENDSISLPSTSNLDWGYGHATNPLWSSPAVICDDLTKPCYLTIQIADQDNKNSTFALAKGLDEKVDSADGSTKGKVRWYEYSGSYVITYQYSAFKMPVM